MKVRDDDLSRLSDTVAMLSADAVQHADSGHPGLPMGAATYASLLFSSYLRFHPGVPDWPARDRFILSAGHGSMLLYSLLHLFGYDLPMEEIRRFRQFDSKTPGHPEFGITPGVEATTGPLGQGAGNAVGVALSGRLMAETYGPLMAHRVFALVSDGDLMEGVASEAASLAGHLGLSELVYLYDDNKITLAGETDVCFTEDVGARFRSYGWNVAHVDAYDVPALSSALDAAVRSSEKPSILLLRSVIGKGSPKKQGTFEAHGSPLGDGELAATKKAIGWPEEPRFHVPDDVAAFCGRVVEERKKAYGEWDERYRKWRSDEPKLAAAFDAQCARQVPPALVKELSEGLGHQKNEATRSLSGKAIQVIAKHVPYFVGGSADLETSTKTLIKDSGTVQAGDFKGRNVRFGVREHAMGALINGMAYQRCWFPFTATFLVFSDYMRASVRLAALSHVQSLFVFTHDSFWVGEDGPTHEPIEHIQSLRLIPNLNVYRPADGVEVGMCYAAALAAKERPSVFVFSRQDLPPVTRTSSFTPDHVTKGGYVVSEGTADEFVAVATGSEVSVAVKAVSALHAEGLKGRVVSMPCVETFLEQDAAYRDSVLPPGMPRVVVEAGATTGWRDYLVGGEVLAVGIDHFGASAPGGVLAEKFGLSPEAVASKIKGWSVLRG